MTGALRAAPFAAYVLLGLFVVWRTRKTTRVPSRQVISVFLIYAVAAGFGPGLVQREMWPFSNWPLVASRHGPVAQHARLMVIDRPGGEHRVDSRAWQPFVSDELVAWVNGRMLALPPADRDRAAEYLVGLAERGARAARQRQRIGYFDRLWGPLTAPYFLLHPRWWDDPEEAPAEPLVGLRLYHDRWNLRERRSRPDAVERTVVYEYRRR